MLKGFASNLLYLVLKSVDRLHDYCLEGFVLHPDYLTVVTEEVNRTCEEMPFFRKEIANELEEGDYISNKNFFTNLDTYFSVALGDNFKEDTLYKIIFEAFTELCSQTQLT